jgi:Membrane bound beta barrel domain (DUF5777)
MKRIAWFNFSSILWASLFLCAALSIQAQDATVKEKDTRPVRNTFESNWLIDNQTVMVPIKGTVEMDINHRFGVVNDKKYDDFYGIFAPSNIRIAFSFVPIEKLQIGFGFTKERKMWDFNAKYALLRQGRSGGSPLSVTYFGNMGIDTRGKALFEESLDRYSFFHQLMVARKISSKLSLQAAGSLSWFNNPQESTDDTGARVRMENKHFAVAFLGRYKITDVVGLIANYDLPLTDHGVLNPESNLSFGIEIVTSAHAFQVFLGNYKSIVPQLNNTLNQYSAGDGDFLIGFNITRLWNL